MKHVRVISLSALLVACSSMGLEGENVTPGNSDKDDKPSVDSDAGVDEEDLDDPAFPAEDPAEGAGQSATEGMEPSSETEQPAVDDDTIPASTIVDSEDALEALVAATDGEAIGGVTLRLVDAPVEADAVNVTFCGVQVHLLASGERPAQDAGAAVGGTAMGEPLPPPQPPEEKPLEPEMMGELPAPPDGSAVPEGMKPPPQMLPPEDDMFPPPEDAPKMAGELPPPPVGSEMLKPADMMPLDQPLKEGEGMGLDGGVLPEEPPLQVGGEEGKLPPPPPPPEGMLLADGGVVLPENMRPSGIVSETPPGHWLGVGETCVTVDLLALQGGVFEALGFAALPVGNYGQIRLNLTEAEVVVDGVAHALTVPSGEESGLKIEGGFTVEDGEITTLTVDFDAARSVEQTNQGDYLMKPVIFLAGAERRVIRPPHVGGQVGGMIDPATGGTTVPTEPKPEPTEPKPELPPVEGEPAMSMDVPLPPPGKPAGEPVGSGLEGETLPPPGSLPPPDMPPPSGSSELLPPPEDAPPPPADPADHPPEDQLPPPPPSNAPAPGGSEGLPPAPPPQPAE